METVRKMNRVYLEKGITDFYNFENYENLVARGRFELPSAGPEPAMLDRYTTGLSHMPLYHLFSFCSKLLYGLLGFFYVFPCFFCVLFL